MTSAAPSPAGTSEKVVSPRVARLFYRQAVDLLYSGPVTADVPAAALSYLMAAAELDPNLFPVRLALFDAAARSGRADLEPVVRDWLFRCPAGVFGRPGVFHGVDYLLAQQAARGNVERVVVQLQQVLGERQPILGSMLQTRLGLAARARPGQRGADLYFARAYAQNKYNRTAFAQLAEVAPDRIDASMALEHLRLAVRENPLDLEAALAYAQYTERLQLYDIAAGSYAYCAALWDYLYEDRPLPGRLYIPWAMSTFNSRSHLATVQQIAERVRRAGVFDLFLEAIAGQALIKAGQAAAGDGVLREAEARAQELLSEGQAAADPNTVVVQPKAMAWYYCFGREDPELALDWANRAYAQEPNDAATGAVLAYALVLNDQRRWAQPLIDRGPANQISELARGRVQLAEGQSDEGVATLNAAIARDAGSLAAERARRILSDLGRPYRPAADAQSLLGTLVNTLGPGIVPTFEPPNERVAVKLGTVNTAIGFGDELEGVVTLVNRSREPLVVGEHGLVQGRIRVDARTEGDLTRRFTRAVELDLFGPREIAAHGSVTAQVPLVAGDLRRLLLAHPQANLNVTFTIFLDPAERADGTPWNRLVDLQPVEIQIGRPGVQITERSLRSRYNALALAGVDDRVRTARLFTGLLQEEQVMAEQGVLYPFRYADWMPAWLTAALVDPAGLLMHTGSQDWVVRVHALDALAGLRLEGRLLEAVAAALQDPHWPVRFRALGLIAANPTPGFREVLAWTAQHDAHVRVRELAGQLAERAATTP